MIRSCQHTVLFLGLTFLLSACTGPVAIIGAIGSTIAKTAENAANNKKAEESGQSTSPPPRRSYDRQEIADANLNLGIAYMQQGQYQAALDKLERAKYAQPDYAPVYNAFGVLYQRLGEIGLAEKNFKYALELEPESSDTLNNYASLLCGTERYDEAQKIYAEAAGNPLYQSPEVALANAGTCALKHDKPDVAENYFRQALEKNPAIPIALYQMAELSCNQGDYLAARGFLERYLQLGTHNSKTLWLGIRIEEQLGDKNALASYKLLLRNQFADSNEAQLLQESEYR